MKIQRLFEIVYILLNKKTISAKELANHFEVSQRTVYRDIEILSAAGIPIYTHKGRGGGIRLMDEFVLNKSVLNEKEQNEILSALQSLKAVTHSETDQVLSKLSSLFNKDMVNWIEVDFSDWSGESEEKFDEIKFAILNKRILQFDYYNANGEKTVRRIEPTRLWFKHKTWYVKSFCLDKLEARVFKLSRMKNLQVIDEYFNARNIEFSTEKRKKEITLKLKIDSDMSFRVYDEFEKENIVKNDDGSFEVIVSYPEDDWVYGYILSFGHHAKILEPEYARKIVMEKLQKSLEKYL